MGSNVIERTDFGRNSVSADLFQIRFRPKFKKNDFDAQAINIGERNGVSIILLHQGNG
jgi:hypothetical protein